MRDVRAVSGLAPSAAMPDPDPPSLRRASEQARQSLSDSGRPLPAARKERVGEGEMSVDKRLP